MLRTFSFLLIITSCAICSLYAQRIPTSYGNNEETDWLKRTSLNFVIVYPNGRSPLADSVIYLAEQTYRFIAEATKRPEVASAFTTFQATVHQRRMILNKDKILKMKI